MVEVDLMRNYPKTDRGTLLAERDDVTEEESRVLRQFGKEYFDGTRRQGLGGYHYHPRFFTPVVETMIEHYGLTAESSVLDVGCAKGFMLHDFHEALPGITVAGVDISSYCMEQSLESVRPHLRLAGCDSLPFEDDSFDLVVSIATIHNLDLEGVKRSLREIIRVSRKHAFVKVNGHANLAEKEAFDRWNVVARTSLYTWEWEALFAEVGYTGDHAWFKV
jgi:SAM-dependent methyltransferase